MLPALLVPALFLVAGCGLRGPQDSDPHRPGARPVVGTYEADVPHLGPGGSRVALQLRPDSVYYLLFQSLTTVGGLSGEYEDDMGRWAAEGPDFLRLTSGLGGVRYFRTARDGTLSMLADRSDGSDSAPLLVRISDDVKRRPSPRARPLFGWYSRSATGALFGECPDGQTVVVASEGAHGEMERAFMADGGPAGGKVLVTIEGYYRLQYDTTGVRLDRAVVPVKFRRLERRGDCPR